VSAPQTLVEATLRAAELAPSRVLYTFLGDGERESETLTCGQIAEVGRAIAATLSATCAPGARVLLVYRPGLAFITAFYGCMLAGVVAVPCYPPDPSRLSRTLPRLSGIAADAEPSALLTTGEVAATLPELISHAPWLAALPVIATDTIDPSAGAAWSPPALSGESVALVQYTSGSTASPRGVVLTHENLVTNAHAISVAFGVGESRGVSWLPVYHDMGLIGHVVVTMLHLVPNVFMSPLSFLARPMRWLRAISTYRATASGGPSFAYDLCVRRYSEIATQGLDLSSWTVAYNGAEPIRAETMRRFAQRFERHGFRARAFHPCYGLAEASLMVTGGVTAGQPLVETVSAAELRVGRASLTSNLATPGGVRELVGCGRPVSGTTVSIVDPETCLEVPEAAVGEIWVQGRGVARQYLGDPARSLATFGGKLAGAPESPAHLRTGDLGYVRDGELFVVGRAKDVVIVRGMNLHAADLELTVEAAHRSVRAGSVAAFAWLAGGEEGPGIVAEIDHEEGVELEQIAGAIRAAITQAHQVELVELALVRHGVVPKTSSGKLMRAACRDALAAGTLPTRWRWSPALTAS
jgi:acyl-CoA synthetase (AMP-forming)/AMP-acid ligase II